MNASQLDIFYDSYPGWELTGPVVKREGYTLVWCRCRHHYYGKIEWLYCVQKNVIGLFADTFDKI